MHAHGIERSLLAYHDHNAERVRPRLIEALRDGKTVALVSDAGTPLVSDPGYKLVQAVLEEDLPVTAVPGASAVLTALSLSGLPSDRFLFGGFLPAKTVARRKTLEDLRPVPGTLIFFESPRRLAEALVDAAAVLGAVRPAAVARELTKLHEEVRRGSLSELAEHYRDAPAPRGEIVLLVGPLPAAAQEESAEEQLDERLIAALKTESLRDAVDRVAAESGLARRRVYRRALELEGGDER